MSPNVCLGLFILKCPICSGGVFQFLLRALGASLLLGCQLLIVGPGALNTEQFALLLSSGKDNND